MTKQKISENKKEPSKKLFFILYFTLYTMLTALKILGIGCRLQSEDVVTYIELDCQTADYHKILQLFSHYVLLSERLLKFYG